jgi:hypothetical protein
MKKSLTIVAGVSVLVLAAAAFFARDIRGYYEFHQLCEREGGLKVFEPLQRGVGWGIPEGQADAAVLPVSFDEVAFVRFRSEKDENLYDVVRAPRIKNSDPGYAVSPADASREVMYRFDRQWADLPGDAPVEMLRFSVTNVKSEALAASYSHYSFGRQDSDSPWLKDCHGDVPVKDEKTGSMLPSGFRAALAGVFAR